MDKAIFATPALSDDQRPKIIERYPTMGNVQYQPPNAIPDAAHRMKPPQTKQDMALKRLQYLISGIFCPLNIFGHEISLDNENVSIQRYLTILSDYRTLLLNLSSQVNGMRHTLAFQTINPPSSRQMFQSKVIRCLLSIVKRSLLYKRLPLKHYAMQAAALLADLLD